MERSSQRSAYKSGTSIVVSLPVDLRERTGITRGSTVVFDYCDDYAVLRKAELSIPSLDDESGP
jgi:bifunctional DNA-binding transcriptional regulator/antitoxin component of YhaV-PrlF toxin-antitoxin module